MKQRTDRPIVPTGFTIRCSAVTSARRLIGRQSVSRGFALPTIMIASVVMLALLLTAISSVTSTSAALRKQHYEQLAREAAESGLKVAEVCLMKGEDPWTAPLTGTDCTAPSNGSYVLEIEGLRTRYSVAPPENSADTIYLHSVGCTDLLRKSNGQVYSSVCSGDLYIAYNKPAGAIDDNSPIQDVSQAQCQALPTFTGSNDDAVRTVTDSRGGTVRTYEIAKLADGNCWMLTNLKLGGSSPITLTPSDSDVASNFILPALTTTSARSYDVPYAYGPLYGDTGLGARNYGYLYNFSAATAGETRATLPDGNSNNAQHSICPASWRLPTGRAVTGDFAYLNAKMNNPDSPYGTAGATGVGYYPNWHYTGPFRGVSSGSWDSGGRVNNGNGYLWSASPNNTHSFGARVAHFHPSYIGVGESIDVLLRSDGAAVRCLLN